MKTFVPLEDIESVLPILSQIAIWGGVSDRQREKIFRRLEVGTFKKGEHVFEQGDEPSHIYIVKRGSILLSITDKDVILEKKRLTVGECFGVASLMEMQRHSTTATALEDTEIMVLSRQGLLQLKNEDIQLFALLMMNIARELARRLNLTDEILLRHMHLHKSGSIPDCNG